MGMPSTPEGRHQPSIFILGDYPGILEMLEVALPEERVRVVIVADGIAALPAIFREEPDLIFIDATLPGLDGYHMCQLIRRNLELRRATIIILSKRAGILDSLRGRIARATAVIKKPHTLTGLVQLIVFQSQARW